MKRTQQLLALCALAALPLGVVTAGQMIGSPTAPSEVKAEKAETKTVKLKVTGMT